jgi:hypothetical protein
MNIICFMQLRSPIEAKYEIDEEEDDWVRVLVHATRTVVDKNDDLQEQFLIESPIEDDPPLVWVDEDEIRMVRRKKRTK